MATDDTGPKKKAYQKPKLTVYGDVRELTHTTGATSPNADAGYPATTKTGT